MNKSTRARRAYSSQLRSKSAEDTQRRILAAARALFGRKGIDRVTIADIGKRADVAASTVYAIYKSKDGILRALMEQALFGSAFQSAQQLLRGVDDPVELIALTSQVARAIYESEDSDLGLVRHASGFSPALRKLEREFERLRYDMQEERVRRLFQAGKARRGLTIDKARQILWMYTSRDVYRMLVQDSGWTPEQYQDWLSKTLLHTLVGDDGAT
jgi:AcrR family transcriptional regulator